MRAKVRRVPAWGALTSSGCLWVVARSVFIIVARVAVGEEDGEEDGGR